MIKYTVSIIALGVIILGTIGVVFSDSEHGYRHSAGEEDEEHEWEGSQTGGWIRSRADVAAAADPVYRAECGTCHFAYQPGLLPAEAWNAILSSLQDHYGDDAALDVETTESIRSYLTAQAADRSDLPRSRAFSRGGRADSGLPRITESRYFRSEHDEIPARWVRDNESVRSFANCSACHQDADSGVYNEHRVRIPGIGRWDD